MAPLTSTIRAWRPGKRDKANRAPIGRPSPAASTVADKVTMSDKLTIANSFASPDQISKALKPSMTAVPGQVAKPRFLCFLP